MVDNPLLKNPATERMKRVVWGGVLVFFFCFFMLFYLSYGMIARNGALYTTLTSLQEGETRLDLPFEWEEMYTFPVGTSVEEMENVSGISSSYFQEVTQEGWVQYYFLMGKQVVSFAVGNAKNVGFEIEMEGTMLEQGGDELFQVDTTGEWVVLREVIR